jgi:hypothetical protein
MAVILVGILTTKPIFNIKEFVQLKMSLNNRNFLIWKEREGAAAGRQADLRLGYGEIEIHRNKETYM